MTRRRIGIVTLWALVLATCATAHEVRPAYLEINQTADTAYKVTWKKPTVGEVAIHLVPHLSNGWLEEQPDEQQDAAGFLIQVWTIHASTPHPLAGATITIEGLASTITDVFVRIRLSNGQGLDAIARPETPVVQVTLVAGNSLGALRIVLLGIEHILSGPDHLAFVFGLLLMVADRVKLLKTVSAFTLAHSLTLAAVSLGYINLPTALLDALIALSILFLAPEALRARSGGTSLTIRHPWIVAFAFGLLHGMGFASGLTSLGLEKSSLIDALVSFNIGVEIGQIGFILLILALQRALRVMRISWPPPLALAPSYTIGALGVLWTAQNCAAVFGIPT
jgi:hypothetical protein